MEDKLLDIDRIALEQHITEDEIIDAVFSSSAQEAQGIDGFSFLFYQTF